MIYGRKLGLALLLAAVAAGCGDDSADDHPHPGVEDGGGHAGDGHHDPMTPCPETIPTFVATASEGIEVTGTSNRITAKLIDADWTPPFKGDNEWEVLFRDEAGDPIEDVELVRAETFMRVHNHPGRKVPVGTKLEEPGVMQFENVNLFMGGPWEVTFEVSSQTAGGTDKVTFHVCVSDD